MEALQANPDIPLDELRMQFKAWGKYDPNADLVDLIEGSHFPGYVIDDVSNGNALRYLTFFAKKIFIC